MKTLVLALALAAATAASAQPDAAPPPRDYILQHLEGVTAEALFWDLCGAEHGSACQVLQATDATLRVRAPNEVQRALARLLAERDVVPSSHRLQLHLLTAGRGEGALPPGLGEGPRRALQDLASVLGFGRFALLDSALVETTRDARTHLAGPDGLMLDAGLGVRQVAGLDDEKLLVELVLIAPGPGEQPEGRGQPPFRPGSLLQTSLSLSSGETVVVGSSRVNGGDEALVLLLTALQ
jgi:hypothetical protein